MLAEKQDKKAHYSIKRVMGFLICRDILAATVICEEHTNVR